MASIFQLVTRNVVCSVLAHSKSDFRVLVPSSAHSPVGPSSIEGYRSMLFPVVSQSMGFDLSSIKVVSDLMASFKTQRPKRVYVLLERDITFVVYMLTKEPFEPLNKHALCST